MKKNLLAFISFLTVCSVQAQLDSAFGSEGKVVTNIGNSTFHVIVQALQPDGKLLMAGDMNDGFNVVQSFVCRVHADGTLDTGFSGGKIMIENMGFCKAIKLQADGKIVIGGSFDGEISLARFNTNGTIDTTFGDGGYVYTLDTSPSKFLSDMVLQPDGKIVVLSNYPNASYRLMRFNADGNPDTAFGTGGWVASSVGTNQCKPITTILQPDGKLLVGGYTFGTGSSYFVSRHNSDGTIDTAFNGTGTKLITHVYSNSLYSIALQSDGKIIYNGKATGPNVMATGRLNIDGTVDTTFGTNGSTLTPLNTDANWDNIGKIKVLPDGKIFALNRISYTDGFQDIFMIRYNPDGSLDTDFDEDGTKVFAYGSGNDFGRDFDLVGNKIWISGNTDINFNENNIAMARFNADGTPDNTFSNDGKAFLYFERNSEDVARAIAIQSDNKIIVGGSTYSNTKDYLSIVRYHPDGSIDTTFGTSGKVLSNKPGEARSIVLQPDGKILAAGFYDITRSINVTRFNVNGSVDNTFSNSSLTAGYSPGMLTCMQLLPNGKILVAGQIMPAMSSDFNYLLMRLNSDGTVDTSFGVNGYCTAGSMPNLNEIITTLKVLPDGKILAGGQKWNDSEQFTHYALLKYNADGTLDTSFANGGIYDGVLPEGRVAVVSIDLQSDGKIITGIGDYFFASSSSFVTAKFDSNGTLDTTFGDNGFARIEMENNARLTTIKILTDQKIIACGTSYDATSNFAVAKYNNDGSPDETFAPDGFLLADFYNSFEIMYAATITADNHIVACGRIYDAALGTHDYALAKFNTNGILGLDEYKQNTIGFYPNPTHDKVIFTHNLQSVSLFTIDGKAIKNLEIVGNEANINELPNGIYLLRYTTTDGLTKTDKLIKN